MKGCMNFLEVYMGGGCDDNATYFITVLMVKVYEAILGKSYGLLIFCT